MKSVVLSLAGALVLTALPALAQTGTTTGSTNLTGTSTTSNDTTGTTDDAGTTTTGTTTGSTSLDNNTNNNTDNNNNNDNDNSGTGYTSGTQRDVNGVPVQEERTNAAVPTHTTDSGLTASGSIVSANDQEIVLKTSTGVTHFVLVPETVGNNGFQAGQTVSIDFTRNEQGVLIAKQVRMGGTSLDQTTTGTTTDTTSSFNSGSTTTGTTGSSVDTDTSSDTTSNSGTTMPATASASPLVALLGLLALGAAAGLRRL